MRTYTVHADVTVEVDAENAADARAKFEAHIKALDEFAGIEIGEEGVYTWTRFELAEMPQASVPPRTAEQDAGGGSG